MKIILLAFLGLIAVSYVAATCSSSFISSNEAAAYYSQCPTGMYRDGSSCKQVTESLIGANCTVNADCPFKWLTCLYNRCVVSETRFIGDKCDAYKNCGSQDKVPLNCVDSNSERKCTAFKKVSRGLGEACDTSKVELNERYVCGSGLICVLETCRTLKTVENNQNCGLDNNGTVYSVCKSTSKCNNGVCQEMTAEGKACTYSYECQTDMVCRTKQGATSKTCQKPSYLSEYCEADEDCYSSQYGGNAKCNVKANKCQRLYSAKVGEACDSNLNCYSGYCSSNKCAVLPVTQPCNNALTCGNSPGSCVCGGKSTTESDGTCAASCQGRFYDVLACAWNKGITSDAQKFVDRFFDKESMMFKSCKNEIQNYYLCMKSSMKTAGVSGAADKLGDFDLTGNAPTGENPVIPTYNSGSSVVASFALILMILAAVFAL